MKMVPSLMLVLAIAVPAAAEDRAPQLSPIDAGAVLSQINSPHNQFPSPAATTLDTCVFTKFSANKCYFKCQSGDVLVEPAMRPDFSSGEPAGPCATHIIRPVKPASAVKAVSHEQTFESSGRYKTEQAARAAMSWAISGLKSSRAEITGQGLIVKGPYEYGFRIDFRAQEQLRLEPAPAFRREIDAYEHMFDVANRMEDDGALVAITEVIQYGPDEYSYVIGYFKGETAGPRLADKMLRVCVPVGIGDVTGDLVCNK